MSPTTCRGRGNIVLAAWPHYREHSLLPRQCANSELLQQQNNIHASVSAGFVPTLSPGLWPWTPLTDSRPLIPGFAPTAFLWRLHCVVPGRSWNTFWKKIDRLNKKRQQNIESRRIGRTNTVELSWMYPLPGLRQRGSQLSIREAACSMALSLRVRFTSWWSRNCFPLHARQTTSSCYPASLTGLQIRHAFTLTIINKHQCMNGTESLDNNNDNKQQCLQLLATCTACSDNKF